MSDVVSLSKALMQLPSVTPGGKNCLDIIIPRLEKLGFTLERFPVGDADNLWARRGNTAPLLCFLGHVDVVPPGPLEEWQSPPFEPTERDGYLFGRGACDMKTGVAASIVAIENFLAKNPDFTGSIALLITTAEEEMDELGTPNVVAILEEREEKIDYCITAEPSSDMKLGDTIRNGRRGSLSASLMVKGQQGHIAYPHLADNPIHKIFAAYAELTSIEWDKGNEDFPPTSLQFSNLNAGTGATNIIPGSIRADINFRFSTEVTADELMQKTEAVLTSHKLDYSIDWNLSGHPFLTKPGELTQATQAAVKDVLGIEPVFSTGGGTSDARFIAPTGAQVVELGVSNRTAHKVNECVSIEDLKKLPALYEAILFSLLH